MQKPLHQPPRFVPRGTAQAQPQADNRRLQVDESLDLRKPAKFPALISPMTALYWISNHNNSNRKLRPPHVKNLSRLMTGNEWRSDVPDPIVFDANAELRNGQHRLHACVESQTPIAVDMVTGADPGLYRYIDCGISRTNADRSNFDERTRVNMEINSIISTWMKQVNQSAYTQTPAERDAFFRRHENSIRWMAERAAFHSKTNIGVSRAAVSVALCRMWEMAPAKAEEFRESLYSVAGKVQQATALRDFIMRRIAKHGGGPGSVRGNSEVVQYCYSAMNAYLEGREIQVIKQTGALKGYAGE